MAYKAGYIWNGTSFDQIGNEAVATLNDYAKLSPTSQTITNTTLTNPTINGAVLSGIFSGSMNLTGRLDTVNLRESFADLTITANVTVMNFNETNIGFIASAPSANFTLNITNVPTDNLKTISVTVMVTQGATGYIPNVLQIDGSAQTIKWLAGVTPTPTSSLNKVDFFNFTLVRRLSAWTVYGNASLNF